MKNLPTPRFVDAEPLLIAGLREPMNENSAQSIPLLWQKFVPFMGATPHQVGTDCFGLCVATDASQRQFYYMAGVEVSDFIGLPQALSPVILPSQRYAIFPHHRHVSSIRETIDAIFDQWLPKANIRHFGQSVHFFERYNKDYNPETGMGGMEIWLPVRDAAGRNH